MMTIFTNPPHFQDILRMTWCSFQPQLGAGVNAPLGRQPKAFHWANQQFQPPRRGGTNHSAKKLLKSKTACFINRNENSPWLLDDLQSVTRRGEGCWTTTEWHCTTPFPGIFTTKSSNLQISVLWEFLQNHKKNQPSNQCLGCSKWEW